MKITALPIQYLGLVLLLGARLGAAEAQPAANPKGVSTTNYVAWRGALAIESLSAETRLILVPEVGGRIMRFELMGQSPFWENPETFGYVSADTRKFAYGGYQMDFGTPTDASLPDSLRNGPWQVLWQRDYNVGLRCEADPATGLQLEKEILLDPEKSEAGVVQRMRNTSAREVSAWLRSRTLCKAGGFVLLPLNESSRFPATWNQLRKQDDRFIYDSYKPSLPQVETKKHLLVAQTTGAANRIGADATAEWVAYAEDTTLLVQYFPYHYSNRYPSPGNTVEIAWNERVTEIEIFGPVTKLAPGAEAVQPAKWVLIDLGEPVRNLRDARALASKIPPSPFRRAK